jgi:hypothetical protein
MPTGPNDLNPRGRAEAARELAEVQRQARGFTSRLLRSKTFAAKFDEALMRRNEKAIRGMLQEAGVSGRVSFEEINPDRKISIKLCGPRGRWHHVRAGALIGSWRTAPLGDQQDEKNRQMVLFRVGGRRVAVSARWDGRAVNGTGL